MKLDNKYPGESNSAYAYRILRKNIMHMDLMPGQAIMIPELTEIMSISRTPIREALFRLREERLVDIYPHDRTCISYIDYNLVQQGLLIRGAIESSVLKTLCGHLKETDLESLEENLKIQYYYTHDDTLQTKFFDLDIEFHHILFLLANSEWAWEILQKACTHHDRIRYLHLHEKNNKKGIEELYLAHNNIINLLLEGNPDAVAKAVVAHVQTRPSMLWQKSYEELSQYIINLP